MRLFDPHDPPIPWPTKMFWGIWRGYWREYSSDARGRWAALWRVIIYRLVISKIDWPKRNHIWPYWALVLDSPAILWQRSRARQRKPK